MYFIHSKFVRRLTAVSSLLFTAGTWAEPAGFWTGNGSIISYYDSQGRANVQDGEYPYGIRQDMTMAHLGYPVAFFQWQATPGSCDRLEISAEAPNNVNVVDITIGEWSSRDNDMTFENASLPFVIGNGYVDPMYQPTLYLVAPPPGMFDFNSNDANWRVVSVAFKDPVTVESKVFATCTDQTPSTYPSAGPGKPIILEGNYRWNGNASIISRTFSHQAPDGFGGEWPNGAFGDITQVSPSPEKPVVFFQWMASEICTELTIDAPDLPANEKQVTITSKPWYASNDDVSERVPGTLPITLHNYTFREEPPWRVIQVAFDNPVSQQARVEAKCTGTDSMPPPVTETTNCPDVFSPSPFLGIVGKIRFVNEGYSPVTLKLYHPNNSMVYSSYTIQPGPTTLNGYDSSEITVGDDWGVCFEGLSSGNFTNGTVYNLGTISNYVSDAQNGNTFLIQNLPQRLSLKIDSWNANYDLTTGDGNATYKVCNDGNAVVSEWEAGMVLYTSPTGNEYYTTSFFDDLAYTLLPGFCVERQGQGNLFRSPEGRSNPAGTYYMGLRVTLPDGNWINSMGTNQVVVPQPPCSDRSLIYDPTCPVTDIMVTTDDDSGNHCNSEYPQWIDVDLNAGAGGPFIKLCLARNPNFMPITGLTLYHGHHSFFPKIYSGSPTEAMMDQATDPLRNSSCIQQDLNEGTDVSGEEIYLCVYQATVSSPDRPPIQDIQATNNRDDGNFCQPGYERMDLDLNQGAQGDFVYLCILQ